MIKTLSKVYFSLLVLSPLTPLFKAADSIAADYIALNIIAIFGVLLVLFKRDYRLKNDLIFLLPLISLLLFLFFCLLSIFFSVNKTESIVTIIKIFVFIANIYIIYSLRIYKIISINYLLALVSFFLFIEIYESLYPLFFEILPVRNYEYRFSNFLVGIETNRNIAAASIVLKIPLVILFFLRSKRILVKSLLIIIFLGAIINLFFLSSRAGLLSLSIILSVIILNNLYHAINQKSFLTFIKKTAVILIIPIVSYSYFNSKIVENDSASIQSRVSSISSSDESATQRIRFYKQAIKYSISNPFNPVGIGNWKLHSIKLDKENINSYIFPYVVHNDFLELLVEISFLGLFFYLIFFFSMSYLCLLVYNNSKEFDKKQHIILIFLALIAYLIDANLNFPLYRPIMQVNLIVVLTLILIYFNQIKKIDEKTS